MDALVNGSGDECTNRIKWWHVTTFFTFNKSNKPLDLSFSFRKRKDQSFAAHRINVSEIVVGFVGLDQRTRERSRGDEEVSEMWERARETGRMLQRERREECGDGCAPHHEISWKSLDRHISHSCLCNQCISMPVY